jgi:hypothetical protein
VAAATPSAGPGEPGAGREWFDEFCLAVTRKQRSDLEKHYGSTLTPFQAKAALTEASGITGGYTAPPDFYKQLLAIVEEKAIFRSRAFVQPMRSATLQFHYPDITTVQAAGTSPFFGGVIMNWTEEAQTRTETEPQFKMIEPKAYELSGYSISSNALLRDSAFVLEKFRLTLFARVIARSEDFAFLQGNSIGEAQGILTAPATISVTRQGSNLVQFQNVANLHSKLLPSGQGKDFWTFQPPRPTHIVLSRISQFLCLNDRGSCPRHALCPSGLLAAAWPCSLCCTAALRIGSYCEPSECLHSASGLTLTVIRRPARCHRIPRKWSIDNEDNAKGCAATEAVHRRPDMAAQLFACAVDW